MKWSWLAFAFAVWGCSVPRGGLSPFDDGDGGVDAARDTSVDVPGVDAPGVDAPGVDAPGVDAPGVDAPGDAPGADSGCGAIGVRSCDGETLRECTPAGLTDIRDCLRGCASGTCNAYDVRNVNMDRLLHVGTAALIVTSGDTVTLNTDDGTIEDGTGRTRRMAGVGINNGISYERQAQAGAPGLGIFSVDSLVIEAGGTLVATGSDVPVILVGGDAVIDGTIDVSASGRLGGIGGFDGGGRDNDGGGGNAGGEVGGRDGTSLGGGGGGGHAGSGGDGGDDGSGSGGNGGAVIDDPGGTPLVGGGGGGGSPSILDNGSHGGGGGGAVQVSAGTSLAVGSTGIVRASGDGGDAGWSSGGGGGAGGSIVLQAPTIDIAGIVVANGGGGGGGQPAVLEAATPGENGRDDTDRARGGDGPGGGKNGGPGGAVSDLSGGDGQDGGPAGGGGGAAGRVSFYSDSGGLSESGTVSPDAFTGTIP